jgi:hypothetical protein
MVVAIVATVALRIMIVEWPPRIAMMNHGNVNHLANVRCNCWPFLQTSLSAKSSAMTGTKVGASTCSVRGKYKRYILATLYYIYYKLYVTNILIHIVIN